MLKMWGALCNDLAMTSVPIIIIIIIITPVYSSLLGVVNFPEILF